MYGTFALSQPRRLAIAGALTWALAFGGLPAMASAADGMTSPKGITAGACVEGICEYTLGNGLRVLLFPDSSKPTITVNIAYNVGSVHENYGETGMAHLLEHLMFKGTPKHAEIPAELKKRGIEKNATTWLDRTNYFGSFPANDATLDWLLGMEADRMVNSFIAKKDLDSEMTVVRNEMEEGENSPFGALSERVRSTAFLWHNYGNSTIGARSDVENVPIERLQAFYKTWYRPDNATLIVAGKIDPQNTLAKIQTHFGAIARSKTALPRFYTAEPTQDGEREVNVRRSGDMRIVYLSYRIPGMTHPDNAALGVLMNVLSDTPTGRLHKALVETKIAAGAFASNDDFRDSGLASLALYAPKDADIAKAEAELLRIAEGLAGSPITEEEVKNAKQRMANVFERGFSDVNNVAMSLTEAVAGGDWRLYFLQRDRIAAVTADDVNRVAKAYFKPSNRTLGRFIPTDNADRVQIASAPAASEALKGFVGKAAVAAGETFDASHTNIQARTQTFVIGEKLKVSLLPKDTRGDAVSVSATFRFGDADALKRVPKYAASVAGALLMTGTSDMSREQIAQKMDGLKTVGGVGGDAQSASINLQTKHEQLAEALALSAQILRNANFPQNEFDQYKLQMITGIEAARKEPGTVAGMAMGKYFDPWPVGHPFAFSTLDEWIAGLRTLTRDDLVAFHRDFYGTAEGEIAIVGDFDTAAVKAQLQTLFAGWRSKHAYKREPTRFIALPAKNDSGETPDKANAVFMARTNLSFNQNDEDYAALIIANKIFGGDPLKARLGDRLRQKDGLSYGATSDIDFDDSVGSRNDAGSLSIQAIVAPENMPKLETAVREEYARFIKDGVTDAEVRDAVNSLLTEREQARAEDPRLLGYLANGLRDGRDMAWWIKADAGARALTAEKVNAAIRKHFKTDALSVFKAGDFAKAAAKPTASAAGK
jgi:zinc protease